MEYLPTFGLNLWVNVRKIFQSHVASLGYISCQHKNGPRSRLRFHRKIPDHRIMEGNSPSCFTTTVLKSCGTICGSTWEAFWMLLLGGGEMLLLQNPGGEKTPASVQMSFQFFGWKWWLCKCKFQGSESKRKWNHVVFWRSILRYIICPWCCQVADVHLHFWGDLLAAHYPSQVFTYRMLVHRHHWMIKHPPFFPTACGISPKDIIPCDRSKANVQRLIFVNGPRVDVELFGWLVV